MSRMVDKQAPGRLKLLTGSPVPTDASRLENAVKRTREAAGTFARLSLHQRIELARSMQSGYLKIAAQSVAAGCEAKGIRPGLPLEGEEWATGPYPIVRQLRLIIESLTALARSGNTRIGTVGKTREGNLSVRVFPLDAIDKIVFRGITVDVRLQEGVDAADLETGRARFYKKPDHQGAVALVLGSGNLAMIPVMDVLTKMFNEGKVCVLKMNPVNAYLGPLIEEAFSAAVDRGFLSVVYGGTREGEFLVRHPGIDEIHITGSGKAFNTIVWGPEGPERNKRIAEESPLLRKKITSELGNVSPIIMTPGPYTARELHFIANDVAGSFTMNAAFLCCTPRILILPKGWGMRERFLDILADILNTVPARKAYYPGARQRFSVFTRGGVRGRMIGTQGEGTLPWTIVSGLDPERTDEILFSEESFCPVLAETAVGSPDPVEFLESAVDFANNRLRGTLSATLMLHPKTAKAAETADAVERAISRLRYGAVCVNGFAGMCIAFGNNPWGGYPGASARDIQSGQGWVHNTVMLEGIEKVVVRFPFMPFPRPGYFPDFRTTHTVARRLTALEEKHSWGKLPGVILAALRG